MELTIETKKMTKLLEMASRIVSPSSTLPILAGIRVSANGKLKITATNLESTIILSSEDYKADNFDIVLPAKTSLALIKLIEEPTIKMLSTEKGKATIIGGKSKSKMVTFDPSDYPTFVNFHKPDASFTIPQETWELITRLVSFSASKDIARPQLNGVHFYSRDGLLNIESADGFRLSYLKTDILLVDKTDTDDVQKIDFILPLSSIIKAAPMLKSDIQVNLYKEEATSLSAKNKQTEPFFNHVVLISKTDDNVDIEFRSQIIFGAFPDVAKVIPDEKIIKVKYIAKLSDLRKSINRCKIFESKTLVLKGNEDELIISVNNSDIGDSSETLNISQNIGDEKSFVVGYNIQFMDEIISKINGEYIEMSFPHNYAPTVFKSIDDNGNYLHVLMPMKIDV